MQLKILWNSLSETLQHICTTWVNTNSCICRTQNPDNAGGSYVTKTMFIVLFVLQERQLELGDRLDLSSYLLEPVQRIPRYKLFLDDLVKTYTNYENERCESDSRISKLSVDSDETGGSNGESSDADETPLESLKLAKTMIECVLTAVDGIMALENITDCPVSKTKLWFFRHGQLVASVFPTACNL